MNWNFGASSVVNKCWKSNFIGKNLSILDIVDFYAPRAQLVIEIDGSQHFLPETQAYEQQRNSYLEQQGLTVLHFNSREVLMEIDDVMKVVFEKVSQQLNPP